MAPYSTTVIGRLTNGGRTAQNISLGGSRRGELLRGPSSDGRSIHGRLIHGQIDERTQVTARPGGGLLVALLVVACGAADRAPVDDPASLQAVLSIERIEDASRGEVPSASAMAQFVVLPSDADAHETLDAAGLRTQLPERKGCTATAGSEGSLRGAALRGERNRGGQAFPDPLELLEAGDVSIHADGMITRLALNLFPPSGSASGVIYTTPDQSATPLPPDTIYAISATGSEAIPPLSIQQRAPGSLQDVTVSGTPLSRATSIAAGQPVDFTWAEGDGSDRVYVEVADERTSILCAFADEDGSGTIPAALTAKLAPESPIRVSLHRVRETLRAQEPPRVDALILETMVRFDFEITSTLRVD